MTITEFKVIAKRIQPSSHMLNIEENVYSSIEIAQAMAIAKYCTNEFNVTIKEVSRIAH